MATVLGVTYFGALAVLLVFGCHRWWLTIRWRSSLPLASDRGDATWRPVVTVQLPLFNEALVVRRAIDAIGKLDYPDERLEVQILDDSDDSTTALAREAAARWRARGRRMQVLHRTNRVGFKAGAVGLEDVRPRPGVPRANCIDVRRGSGADSRFHLVQVTRPLPKTRGSALPLMQGLPRSWIRCLLCSPSSAHRLKLGRPRGRRGSPGQKAWLASGCLRPGPFPTSG